MTSPEALVARFLHRFSRRSLDPIPSDGLLAARQRIEGVLDERARQFSLFDAPADLSWFQTHPLPPTRHQPRRTR